MTEPTSAAIIKQTLDDLEFGRIERLEAILKLSQYTYTANQVVGYDGFIRGTWSYLIDAVIEKVITDEEYNYIARTSKSEIQT